ncbi:hypothetical protein OG921_15470 [Aldersonia sp. NBC_00410]|uniref:hypothetical protein n=1 Tax=Aldersonia sp. NBC_00410 TaxID=2975954 RepID=UPI00225989C3|nr:hypothetical protein [Aldersonia sp. NBC_00410]MCX5044570.1 hypothetical protein [Aldersonia sp. NBC_00410]
MSAQPEQPEQDRRQQAPPALVRVAGALVALEGTIAVVVAIVLIVRAVLGQDQSATSGYGTAAWFIVLGGAVLAGGVALLLGYRWGRAIAIVAQVLLLPVVWALLTDSDQPVWGSLLGVVVVATLGLLFSGPTTAWMAELYERD